MKERELLSEFIKKLREYYPEGFFYKIPDTPQATHRKPFDMIACHNGEFYAIEAKKEGGKIKEHQHKSLIKAEMSGGYAAVIEFFETPENHRSFVLKDLKGEGIHVFFYMKGKYPEISQFFKVLKNYYDSKAILKHLKADSKIYNSIRGGCENN